MPEIWVYAIIAEGKNYHIISFTHSFIKTRSNLVAQIGFELTIQQPEMELTICCFRLLSFTGVHPCALPTGYVFNELELECVNSAVYIYEHFEETLKEEKRKRKKPNLLM